MDTVSLVGKVNGVPQNMMDHIEELRLADEGASTVPFLEGERTPAGLARLACAVHATAASLAEIRDLLTWFGMSRSRPTIHNWCHSLLSTTSKRLRPTIE